MHGLGARALRALGATLTALLAGCVVYDPALAPGAVVEAPPAYPYYPPAYAYTPPPAYPYYPYYRPYWYGPSVGINFGYRFGGRRRWR